MLRKIAISLILMGLSFSLATATPAKKERFTHPSPMTGCEDAHQRVVEFSHPYPSHSLDEAYEAGNSWYDLQANGTAGKHIAVSADGKVHVVWTNGLNNGSATRHVYYNVWDPSTEAFTVDGGSQIDASTRAGFVAVDVDREGFAYPAFHQIAPSTGPNAHAAVSIDFLPGTGAFTTFPILPIVAPDAQIIWPHIAVSNNRKLQVVSTENLGAGLDYYSRGTPNFDGDGFGLDISWDAPGFVEWAEATFITLDVACSWQTNRVAVAWLKPNENTFDDVWLRVSEDGGVNWGEDINVTNFPIADTSCITNGGTPESCNALYDTLHPWLDCSILIDQNDDIHIAFTCGHIFGWDETGGWGPWITGLRESNIWHWDETNEEFNFIAEGWAELPNASNVGSNMLQCHRPSLGVDTTTGHLFCSFQRIDSLQTNDAGYPQADAWLTVSTTGGRSWAKATNISNTDGGVGTPPPGSMSERDITIAKFVTDGFVHMLYQIDHDAGTSLQTEGVATLNEHIYTRIPVETIPLRPLENPYRAMHNDSSGYPFGLDTTFSAVGEHNTALPLEFALYQNYPNPFNPNTNIQFDLRNQNAVSLKIFDILGREVATLINNEVMNAGVHVVEFDASSLASGVYLYRLDTPSGNATRKMMLMK